MVGVSGLASQSLLGVRQVGNLADQYSLGPDDINWGSSEAGTVLTVGGSQALSEREGLLCVNTITGGSSDTLNCRLFARTFTVGDFWAVPFWWYGNDANNHAGVAITNGVVATSTAAVAAIQSSSVGPQALTIGRHGTLNALSTNSGFETRTISFPFWVGLKYVASNSFQAYFSSNGFTWRTGNSAALTPTMTPTHVAVGWSAWAVGNQPSQVTYGSLRRLPAP